MRFLSWLMLLALFPSDAVASETCPVTTPFSLCVVREFCDNCDDIYDWRKISRSSSMLDLPSKAYKLKGYSKLVQGPIKVYWDTRTLTFDRVIRFEIDNGSYLTRSIKYDFGRGLVFPKIRQELIHQFTSLKGIEVVSADNNGVVGHWRLLEPLEVCGVKWPTGTQFSDFGNDREIEIRPLKSFKVGSREFTERKMYTAKPGWPRSGESCRLTGPSDANDGDFDWDFGFNITAPPSK